MANVITKSYKKDIFCIEGHWEKDMRKTDSIQPALKLLNLNMGVKFYYQRSATLEEIAHVSLEYSKKNTTNTSFTTTLFMVCPTAYR